MTGPGSHRTSAAGREPVAGMLVSSDPFLDELGFQTQTDLGSSPTFTIYWSCDLGQITSLDI